MPEPTDALWDEAVGPFYDAAGLAKWLGVSPEELRERTGKRLFAVKTGDGEELFPSFQFQGDRSVLPHLMEVVQRLEKGLHSSWSVATWLNASVDDLGNRSIVDCLKQGDASLAIEWAAREADRLAS